MQRSRRQDPYPLTWEVPLAACVAVALALVLAAHLARAIANVLAGQPWRWPPRTELFASLPALVRGDATAGLPPAPGTTLETGAAQPHLLWACLAATAVLALLLMAWVAKRALDRWGPARLRGMATRVEVEQLLGRSRLRRNRATIRPDLYPRRRHLHHGRPARHAGRPLAQPGAPAQEIQR